ncbi:MAG: heavy-metal-associated domain-containing protein [Pseudomonadota bacterium]
MQTEHLNVTGMTCGSCVSKVTEALKSVGGVGEVTVSLPNHAATVQYDETRTAPDQLAKAVIAAGYEVGATDTTAPQPAKRGCC